MAESKDEVTFPKTTAQVDLETRLKNGNKAEYASDPVNPKDVGVVSDDGFVGVDPIYQNAANKTDRPIAAKSGPDKAAEEAHIESVEGDANEPSEQLAGLYGDVSRSGDKDSEGVSGGEAVPATQTPDASDAAPAAGGVSTQVPPPASNNPS